MIFNLIYPPILMIIPGMDLPMQQVIHDERSAQMETTFNEFVNSWNSHGTPVKGYANLFFGRFIIFMADETATGVSGCSTDSSVRLVKAIESKYKVDLFDRQSLAFIVKDKIELIPLSQFNYAVENNFISENTAYFNNTVLTKRQLIKNWISFR